MTHLVLLSKLMRPGVALSSSEAGVISVDISTGKLTFSKSHLFSELRNLNSERGQVGDVPF